MENINIAKICGLCAGCKRAINVAHEELKSGKDVTIFKEIVHNKNVNESLKTAGAKFANDLSELKNSKCVVIRAHGEPPETYKFLSDNKIEYKDCTCFNVEKIHKLVEEHANAGYKIIILGKWKKALHPEVLGTKGWAFGNDILIELEDDLDQLKKFNNQKFYLVCQTTFNLKKAEELILKIEEILSAANCELIINKSICMAQKQINISSEKLAEVSDIMIVVGGKNSSNSIELFNNMKSLRPSIFIENINDYQSALKDANIIISKNTKIGITAGASTMIEELEDLKQKIQTEVFDEN